MKLQVNQKGSWRDMFTFCRTRRRAVSDAVERLDAAVGGSFKWCFVDDKNVRHWLEFPMNANASAYAVELAALQSDLAYSAARSDIEITGAQPVVIGKSGTAGGSDWYIVNVPDAEDQAIIDIACRYLDLIGKLERKPGAQFIVRVLDAGAQ